MRRLIVVDNKVVFKRSVVAQRLLNKGVAKEPDWLQVSMYIEKLILQRKDGARDGMQNEK